MSVEVRLAEIPSDRIFISQDVRDKLEMEHRVQDFEVFQTFDEPEEFRKVKENHWRLIGRTRAGRRLQVYFDETQVGTGPEKKSFVRICSAYDFN